MFASVIFISRLIIWVNFSNTIVYSGSSFPVYKINTDIDLLFCCNVCCNSVFCSRQASLINRFILFLSTAFLKCLLLTPKPVCNVASTFCGSHITLNGKLAKLLPLLKIIPISLRLFSLSFFLKKYRCLTSNYQVLRLNVHLLYKAGLYFIHFRCFRQRSFISGYIFTSLNNHRAIA